MNKANVFLLVVVSSLLTYISTATQPAATTGVAQEKWEYGSSQYTGVGDSVEFVFYKSSEKKGNLIVGGPAKVAEELKRLGDQGWYPYHVDEFGGQRLMDYARGQFFERRVYWRRRVQ